MNRADSQKRHQAGASASRGGQFAAEGKSTDVGVSLAPDDQIVDTAVAVDDSDEIDAAGAADQRMTDYIHSFAIADPQLTAAEQQSLAEREMMRRAHRYARHRNHRAGADYEDVAQSAIVKALIEARRSRPASSPGIKSPGALLDRTVRASIGEQAAAESGLNRHEYWAQRKYLRRLREVEGELGHGASAQERQDLARQMRREEQLPATDVWWQHETGRRADTDITTLGDAQDLAFTEPPGADEAGQEGYVDQLAARDTSIQPKTLQAMAWPLAARMLDLPAPQHVPRSEIAGHRRSVESAGGVRAVARAWNRGDEVPASSALFAPFGGDQLTAAEQDQITGFLAAKNEETAEAMWNSALACARNPSFIDKAGALVNSHGAPRRNQ